MTAERPAPELVHTYLIGGRAVAGDGPAMTVPNPATGLLLGELAAVSVGQADEAVRAAHRAFEDGPWARLAPPERSRALHRLADTLDKYRELMVSTIVSEVGTPVSTAVPLQFDVPLAALRWMADAAGRDRTTQLGPDFGPVPSFSIVAQRPVGVVVAITAYNYPLTLAVWKLAAALAAGCTVVLVPSPRTPFTLTLLGRIVEEAELPPGVVNVVAGHDAEVARSLSTHPLVDKLTFTGSDAVGRLLMSQASDTLKSVVLELGGKSANIVLPGTDLTSVLAPMHFRYLRNAGQGCAAPTRLLVHESQYDEYVERSLAFWPAIRTGDPWDPATVVGPLIRPEHLARVAGMVEGAAAGGADILAGGRRLDAGGGWFYEPTLIGGVTNGDPIAREEIFGPVGVLLSYADVDDAVRLANDSPFGLAANVYGADVGACLALAERLRVGTITVNGGGGFRPDAPFGGFKQSGLGRELGEWGIDAFLEPQHIQVALAAPPRRA